MASGQVLRERHREMLKAPSLQGISADDPYSLLLVHDSDGRSTFLSSTVCAEWLGGLHVA